MNSKEVSWNLLQHYFLSHNVGLTQLCCLTQLQEGWKIQTLAGQLCVLLKFNVFSYYKDGKNVTERQLVTVATLIILPYFLEVLVYQLEVVGTTFFHVFQLVCIVKESINVLFFFFQHRTHMFYVKCEALKMNVYHKQKEPKEMW